jgi:hypothetical protein
MMILSPLKCHTGTDNLPGPTGLRLLSDPQAAADSPSKRMTLATA